MEDLILKVIARASNVVIEERIAKGGPAKSMSTDVFKKKASIDRYMDRECFSQAVTIDLGMLAFPQ